MKDEADLLSYTARVAQIEAEARWNERWNEMRESRDAVEAARAERERERDEILLASPCALCGETALPEVSPQYCLQFYSSGQFVMGRLGFKVCGNCIDAWEEAVPPPCSDGLYPEWYATQTMMERLRYHQTMYMANRVRRQGGHFVNLDAAAGNGGGDAG